jgi:hypothetical protein
MSFFQVDSRLKALCEQTLQATSDRFSISTDRIALTLLEYDRESIIDLGRQNPTFLSYQPLGYSHRGTELTFPASVAKLFYLVAYHEWQERRMIDRSPEVERALRDMIVDSGNDATGLIVDVLTGTTSGPELAESPFGTWKKQRQIVNRYFQSLSVPEYSNINVCQKVWAEAPYGRERAFYGQDMGNRNLLTTDATAHLLHSIISGVAVNSDRSQAMRELLCRSLDPKDLAADPENQVTGFLGGGLADTAKLWSKAGLMSKVRHDAAYIEIPGKSAFTLVVFTEGFSQNLEILPFICQAIAT